MSTPAGLNRFGQIDGVNEGHIFDNRPALSQAGVHAPTQNGISGTQTIGCDSIVLNGAYRGDDRGDVINYSGENPRGGTDADDKLLVGGNLSLKVSHDNKLPVRVTRGSGTNGGLQEGIDTMAFTEWCVTGATERKVGSYGDIFSTRYMNQLPQILSLSEPPSVAL